VSIQHIEDFWQKPYCCPGDSEALRLDPTDGASGKVDVLDASPDGLFLEKVVHDESAKRGGDLFFPVGQDGRVGNGDAEGMPEQGDNCKPVGEGANHGGFRESPHPFQHRMWVWEAVDSKVRHDEQSDHPKK
jgi:hypothetical protein